MLNNRAELVPHQVRLVEEYSLATPTISIEHALLHHERTFSISGSMSITTAQSGAIVISPPADVQATVTINMTNALADLTYTAVAHGTEGNDIAVTHVDPGGVTAALAVSVTGKDITVSLARAASAITSTAAEVKAAVNAHPAASALVTCEDEGAGTGIVNAVVHTHLAGGTHLARVHLKAIALSCTVGPLIVSFMENYTIDADASTLTPMNRNRNATRTSPVVVKGKANATVTAGTGPLTLDTLVLPGSVQGQTKLGSTGQSYEEWELVPGKNYVLAIPNATGSTSVVGYSMFWYEMQE